jgi:hypothetical protein
MTSEPIRDLQRTMSSQPGTARSKLWAANRATW